jgi:hypothetical protein
LVKIKFKYKQIATSQKPYQFDLMPIIPITLCYKDKRITVEGLVDSGANRCFCPIEIAEALDIPIADCEESAVSGVGGNVRIWLHEVDLSLEHDRCKFCAEIGFGKFDFHGFTIILGQRDFFENVSILFERRKERFELHLPI